MSPRAARIVRIAVDIILVAAVSFGAMKFFELGLRELAATGFWKAWVADHPGGARLLPALAIALAFGFIGGIVLGGFAGGRAHTLAYWSGAALIALDFGGMIVTDGPAGLLSGFALAPLCLAIGLIAGAALGGKVMAGPPK